MELIILSAFFYPLILFLIYCFIVFVADKIYSKKTKLPKMDEDRHIFYDAVLNDIYTYSLKSTVSEFYFEQSLKGQDFVYLGTLNQENKV